MTLSLIFQVKRVYALAKVLEIRFKITCVIYASNHSSIGGRLHVCMEDIPSGVEKLFLAPGLNSWLVGQEYHRHTHSKIPLQAH